MDSYDNKSPEMSGFVDSDNNILDLQQFLESGQVSVTATTSHSPVVPVGEATIQKFVNISPWVGKFINSQDEIIDLVQFLTSGAIKVNVDTSSGDAPSSATYITNTDQTTALPNSDPLSLKPSGFLSSTTGTGALSARLLIGSSNQIEITNADGSDNPSFSLSANLILPGTLKLGGNLNVTGWDITSAAGQDITLTASAGLSSINLNAVKVNISSQLAYTAQPNNNFMFSSNTQTFNIGSNVMDLTNSGFRLGGANSRISTINDDSSLSAASSTTMSTDGSIKTYIDGKSTSALSYSYITKTDNTANLPNSTALSGLTSGFLSNTTSTGVLNSRILTGTANQINVSNGDGLLSNPIFSLSNSLVFPGTAKLGGDLDVTGWNITAAVGSITLQPASGDVIVNALSFQTSAPIQRLFESSNNITFSVGAQTYNINNLPKIDLNSAGVRFGGSGARVTTINNDPTLLTASSTTLGTDGSIKTYIDNKVAAVSVPDKRIYSVRRTRNATYNNILTGFSAANTFDGAIHYNNKIFLIPENAGYVAIIDLEKKTIDTTSIPAPAGARKWGGAVQSPARPGVAYLIPQTTGSIGILNMDNYTLDTTTMTGSFSQSFYGGAASPHNGFIYSFPYNDNAILKINPYNNTYSTILSGSFGVTPQRFQGSVLSSYNGSIYGIPRTGSNYIAKFNPITETVNATAIGPFPGTNKFNAGAEGKDGKIYLAPQTFNFIGILDPVTDTLNTTSLTGLTGYNGAVLSQNGYVYMSPGAASNVAIINTDTVTVDTTTIAGLGAGNKFFGIINSPTGEILCVPNGATYSLIIESGIPTIDVGWCTSVYANHY